MFNSTSVTIDLAVLAALLVCAASLGAISAHFWRRGVVAFQSACERNRSDNRLMQMLRSSEALSEVVDPDYRATPQRAGYTGRTDAMLRARLDHMREVQQIWGTETREAALRQVAALMRNSLRSSDGIAPGERDLVSETQGDGFTILVRGAREADAAIIAQRLRRALARSRIDGLADNLRLSASFGVAGRRAGESFTMWQARAQTALGVANARGEDQIVEASVVEEMRLLPPPSPPIATSPLQSSTPESSKAA